MRFRTIWSIPAMTLTERLRRTRDWAAMKVAAALPQRVKFWCTMLEIGKATRESMNIPGTPLEEILRNLETPKSLS
jgi:hypothetical protein